MRKLPEDVRGYREMCPGFIQCPLCYGCRNYDPSLVECQKCAEEFKKNVCNKEKHTNAILPLMINRPVIKID